MLVLNGSYILCKYVNSTFTEGRLLKFVRYFDNKKIGKYIVVLRELGYFEAVNVTKGYKTYKISIKGVNVIEELSRVYEMELNRFLLDHNIVL